MSYITVKNEAAAEYIEKRSRFIATCAPVKTVKEATDFIDALRKKYWDATHNVYAYSVKSEGVKRFSDDGEPQGTAGMPVLDVLEKTGVTDCVIVVTRYFGGVLLGTGGLVRAYSKSAKLGLTAAGLIEMRECTAFTIACDYSFYGRIEAYIRENGGQIDDTRFAENIEIDFTLENTKKDRILKNLTDVTLGRFTPVEKNELYKAFPLELQDDE